MKVVKLCTVPEFQPVTLNITLESEQEVAEFGAIFDNRFIREAATSISESARIAATNATDIYRSESRADIVQQFHKTLCKLVAAAEEKKLKRVAYRWILAREEAPHYLESTMPMSFTNSNLAGALHFRSRHDAIEFAERELKNWSFIVVPSIVPVFLE